MSQHAGHKVFILLEVVRNHACEKARFLNGGSYSEANFEAAFDPATVSATENLRYVHPSSAALHILDKPLSFDDAHSAVFAMPLPLIVVGSAGSGKTALTLEKLKTIAGQGLYLTHSSFLVESSRNLSFANRYENGGQEVDFYVAITTQVRRADPGDPRCRQGKRGRHSCLRAFKGHARQAEALHQVAVVAWPGFFGEWPQGSQGEPIRKAAKRYDSAGGFSPNRRDCRGVIGAQNRK